LPNIDDLLDETKFEPSQNTSLPEARKEPKDEFTTGHPKTADAKPQPRAGRLFENITEPLGKAFKKAGELVNPYVDTIKTNAAYRQLEQLERFFEERGLAFECAPIKSYVDNIYAVLMADGVDDATKAQFSKALNNIILTLHQLIEKRAQFEKYVAGTGLEPQTLNAFEEFLSNYAAQFDGYDVGSDVLEYSFVEIETLLMQAKQGFELKESLPALIKAGVHANAPNIACNYDDFIEDSLALVTKDDLNSAPFPSACQVLESAGIDPQKLLRWAMNPNADHTDRKMVEAGLALYKAMTISAADRLDDIGWTKKLEETETVDAATVKILEQKLAMVRKELEALKHEVEEKITFKDENYKNAVLSELNTFIGGAFTLHEYGGDVSAKYDGEDPVIRTQDDAPASDEYLGSLNIMLAKLRSGNATQADITAAAKELERANLLMLKAAEIKRGGFEDDGYVPELRKIIDDRVAMLEGMKKQLDETGHGTFKFNFFAGDYHTSTLAFDKAIEEYRALLTLPEEEAWGRFASLERSPLMKTLQKRFDDMEFGEFCRELGITTLTTIPTLGGAGLVRAGLTRLLGAASATNWGKDLIFAGELVYFTASGAGMGKVLNNNPLLPYDNVEENVLFYGKDLLIGALTLRLFHGVENGIGGMMFKKAEAEATTRLVNRGIIKAGATLNAEQFKLLAAETKLVMNGFKHGAQTLGLRFPALFVGMTGIAQVDAVVEGVKAWDVQVALDGAAAAFDKKTMLLRLWSTLDMIAVGIMTGPIIKAANEAAVRKIVDGYRGKIDSALDGYSKAKTEWERGGKQGTKEFEAAIKKLESVIQEGKQLAKTYPQYFDMWGLVIYEMYLDKVREAAAEVNRKPEYVAEKLPIVDLAQRLEGVPNVVLPDWGVSEPVAPNVTPSEEAPKVPKASDKGQAGSDAMTPKQPNPRQHRMPVADGIPLAQLKPTGFVAQAKGIVGRGVNNALAEVGVGAKEVAPEHYLLEPGIRTYTSQGEYSEPFSAGWGVAMRVLKKFAGRMHELDRETYNNAVDAETKDPLVRYKAKSEYDTIIDCQGIEPLKGRRYMGGVEIGDGNHRASAASGFPLLVEEGTTEGNPKPARVLGGKRDATFDVLLKQQLDVLEIRKDDLARPIYTKMIAAYKLGDVGKYREALERLAGLREELKSQPSNRARKLLLEQIDKRIKFLKWRAQHPAPQLNPADWTERPTKGVLETAREAEYRAGVWKGVEEYAASVGGYIIAAFNDATGDAASGELFKAGRAMEKNHGRLSDEKARAEVLDFLERQVIPKVTGELKTPFAVEKSFNVRTKVGERVFTFKAEFDGAVLKVSVKDGDGKIVFSESKGDLVLMHGGFPFDMAAKQLWRGLKTLFKIDGKTEAPEAKARSGSQPVNEGGQVSPAKVKSFALDEASSRPLKNAAKLKETLAAAKSIEDFVAILENAGVADVEIGGVKYSSSELAKMCKAVLYGSKEEAIAAAKDLGWVGELFSDLIYNHQRESNFFPQFHELGGVYLADGPKLKRFIQNSRSKYYEGRMLFYKLVPDGMKYSEGHMRLEKLLRDLKKFNYDADSFDKLIKIFNDSGLEVGAIVADLQLIQIGRLSPELFLKKFHAALETRFLPFGIEQIVYRVYNRENAALARAHLIGAKEGISGEVLPTAGSWAFEAYQLQKKIAGAKSIEELVEILKGTELVSISTYEVREGHTNETLVVKEVLKKLSNL